eukprot:s142_g12.t2
MAPPEANATLPGTPLRSPRTGKAATRSASPTAVDACLAVTGLPADATPRELHVLFSGCPGYVASSLVLEDNQAACAWIHFDTADSALTAAKSRRNTSWVVGQKVDLEVRHPDQLGDVMQRRGRKASPKQPRPSPKPREASAGRSKVPKAAAKATGHSCTVEANFARARVEEALRKNRFPELASALLDSLTESSWKRGKNWKSINTGWQCEVPSLHSSARDAWELLETGTDSAKRISCAEQAIREGEEACKLCAKAAQKVEESRLREAVEVLCKKWVRLVQAKIRDARYDSIALRAAVTEAEALVAAIEKSMLNDRPAEPSAADVDKVLEDSSKGITGDRMAEPGSRGYPDAAVSAAASLRKAAGAGFFDPSFLEALQEARHNVVDEENKAAVRTKLEAALDETSPSYVRSGVTLQTLLREARAASVDAPVVKRGEIRLAVLEGQAAARWMLFTSFVRLQRGTLDTCIAGPDDMKYTLKLAKNMGLGRVQLQPALEFYDKLEKLRVVVRALSEALREQDLARMREVWSGINPAEVLRRILTSGVREESPVIALYIERLQKRLTRAEEQEQVGDKLKEVMAKSARHTQVLEELPVFIEEAQRAGMRHGAVKDAKQQLKRSTAHKRLEAALDHGGGLQELQEAYDEAVAAGVDETLLSEAYSVKDAQELKVQTPEGLEELEHLILECADMFQLGEFERHLKLWHERSYESAAVDKVVAEIPHLRELVQRCQESLENLKAIPLPADDAATKLERSTLDVLGQASAILRKSPRLPIVIEVFSSARQAADAQERSLQQAMLLKQELSKRCSNTIRACGHGPHPSGSKVGSVRLRVDTGSDPPFPGSREDFDPRHYAVAEIFQDYGVTKDDVTLGMHRRGSYRGCMNGEARVKCPSQDATLGSEIGLLPLSFAARGELAEKARMALNMSQVGRRYVEIYLMSKAEVLQSEDLPQTERQHQEFLKQEAIA